MAMTLFEEHAQWHDTPENNKRIVERFTEYVNADDELRDHRDYVHEHVYGFGEKAFWWMWKLIVDQMPEKFSFLEIGVFKGAIPSLIRLLADRTNREVSICGVTPLSPEGGRHDSYPDDDYMQAITDLHVHFGQKPPKLYVGLSADPEIQAAIKKRGLFSIIYVDGGHDYEVALADLFDYGPRVKKGGFLVVDDCASYLAPVWGHYQGIQAVSDAVRVAIETDPAWEHVLSVMHDRVWMRTGTIGERTLDPPPIREWMWASGHKAVQR